MVESVVICTSKRFELNQQDINRWTKNFFLFSAPWLLVGLIGLQQGLDWRIAATLMGKAFVDSLVDLTRKFVAQNS